jgi:sulfatase modifying factor 1
MTPPRPILFPNMVRIHQRTFIMGAQEADGSEQQADSQPPHKVTVSSFYIDAYEFTYGDLQRITGEKIDSTFRNKPLVNVSWYKANELCQKQGKRLPTEAEWEAAAGSNQYATFTGQLVGEKDNKLAIFDSSSTQDVQQSGFNYFRVYGLTGNVSEWVADWYGKNYYEDVSKQENAQDPQGPESGSKKVVRGGSFGMRDPNLLLTTYRDFKPPHMETEFTGFRCVVSAKE